MLTSGAAAGTPTNGQKGAHFCLDLRVCSCSLVIVCWKRACSILVSQKKLQYFKHLRSFLTGMFITIFKLYLTGQPQQKWRAMETTIRAVGDWAVKALPALLEISKRGGRCVKILIYVFLV